MIARRTILWLAAALVLLVVVVLGGPALARRLAFFRVRQIEVIGLRYLDETDVVRRLGLRAGASTFDRLAAVRLAARAIPGVVDAKVARRLPGTLRVTIREATPVALVPTSDRLVLVDSRGRILPFDPVRAPTSLPIAGRDSATAALLGRLMLTDPVGYDSVDSAQLDRGDVVLDGGSHRVRLRPEAGDDILRGVMVVRRYLAEHHIAWREIDARYHSRLFVRKAPA